jgi:2-keto-3-deoxy-L-rhamnonate aldolase RhmA
MREFVSTINEQVPVTISIESEVKIMNLDAILQPILDVLMLLVGEEGIEVIMGYVATVIEFVLGLGIF